MSVLGSTFVVLFAAAIIILLMPYADKVYDKIEKYFKRDSDESK